MNVHLLPRMLGGKDHGKRNRRHKGGRHAGAAAAEDPARHQVDHVDRSDAEERHERAADQDELARVVQEVGSEGVDGLEPAEERAEQVEDPVGERQQVHQQGRLVEPMGVQITGPQCHRALDEVELVPIERKREVVEESPQPHQGRDADDSCHRQQFPPPVALRL